MKISETRYAQSGEINIAYRLAGDGPFDVVFVPPAVSNVDKLFDESERARFLEQIASFSRLIVLDKRGTGLSDRVAGIADIETRMDDLRAVMDAVGSERAAVFGVSEGGPMSIVFAATYPERTAALVLFGTLPRFTRASGFPFGPTREEFWREAEHEIQGWGTVELAREWMGDEAGEDEVRDFAQLMRQGASPGAYRQLEQMNLEIDVRAALPSIRVPTLVLHRAKDHISFDGARWMAEQIPGARFVEVPGWGHMITKGDWRKLADEIESFLVPIGTGARVASKAAAGEVLVSQTVKDLVAGSGIVFEDRGAAELKGVPGEWRLYAVADAAS